MVTTTDISELVTCEVGPETSVAGEGDRPIAVDGSGVLIVDGMSGADPGGVILPVFTRLRGLRLFIILSSSVPESLS